MIVKHELPETGFWQTILRGRRCSCAFMPEITLSANFRLHLSVMMVSHCSHFLILYYSWFLLWQLNCSQIYHSQKSLKLHMCIILFLELWKIDDGDDGKLTPDFWQV